MESAQASRLQRSQRQTSKKIPAFKEERLDHKLHKLYLGLAIFLGTLLALFMPFFSEPDGVFHFVNASNIAGITVDISAYGEDAQWFGDQFDTQRPSFQQRFRFEKYFKNEVQRMPIEDLPRQNSIPPRTSFRYWSSVIPAVGVWLGYHIFPSLGMMITVARLLNMFVLSTGIFFIIKYVKRGKLFFILTTLNPITLNIFASLSNDGLSVVLVSWMVSLAINAITEERFNFKKLTTMLLLSIVIRLAAKTNFLVVLGLIPLLGFVFLSKGRLEKFWQILPKLVKIVIIIAMTVVVLLVGHNLTERYGGLSTIFYRLFINTFYNFSNNAFSNFSSALTTPLWGITPMPNWLSAVWLVALVLAAFSEEKIVHHAFLSWGSLAIYFANMFGLYLVFFEGYASGRNAAVGQIGGLQGRYITPLFLLLFIFASDVRFKLKVSSRNIVALFSVVLIIISNLLLLFNTLFQIYLF